MQIIAHKNKVASYVIRASFVHNLTPQLAQVMTISVHAA
jgi:hypothetical protein